MTDTDGYRSIRDYAVIGDCHGHALIASNGDIDWSCLERHDQDPVFCRLLDKDKGGFLETRPDGATGSRRAYEPGTNVLVTTIETESGRVRLTDFMPVGRRIGSTAHDYVNLVVPGWIVRRVLVVEGSVRLRIRYRPVEGFARSPVRLDERSAGVGGDGVPALFCKTPLKIEGNRAEAVVRLEAGERLDLILAARHTIEAPPLERTDAMEATTLAFWREWIAYCRYQGPYREAVERSALVLKLMTFAPTGAIAAALTTSLPEEIGGARNWDYRFSWLRDSCFALYALGALGYGGEAERYVAYLTQCVHLTLPDIQVMYGLQRERFLPERELDHLEGYRGSRPVRTGNAAFRQRQIDAYGLALDLILLYEALGGRLDEQERRLMRTFVDTAKAQWDEPDQGLWEMRGPPHQHVHGKIMSWVAMDRALGLFGDEPGWRETRERIRDQIVAEGIDGDGVLRQTYNADGIDAANLLAPLLGFPLPDGVLDATIRRTNAELRKGPFLYRYTSDDGLNGGEGAFLTCSFWLVDALLAADGGREARPLFEEMLAHANDVGLFSEEINPATSAFLGNMPQAFTHLGLISAAVNLELYAKGGASAVAGTYADRAKRAVGAAFGLKGVLSSLYQTGTIHRLTSSEASIMAWP
ncbi:MAG: glycoside hydrolase family 15 protein [Geminicoccaceae bacterium]|nr:glycoside hydrolase family 15 protein [Geminicoccaceae bacterium]